MDAKSLFLDTNILVYLSDPSSPWHRMSRETIVDREVKGTQFYISRQILREYLSVVTRDPSPSIQAVLSSALRNVDIFQLNFNLVDDSPDIFRQLLQLLKQVPAGGKQIHDANIVATMLVHDVKHLLTHNVQDFERFANLITILPLESE